MQRKYDTVGDNLIKAGKYQYIGWGLQVGGFIVLLLNPSTPAIAGLLSLGGTVFQLMVPNELIKAGTQMNL